MKRTFPALVLATFALLSGCSVNHSSTGETPPTSSASPVGAGRNLAARYRNTSGDRDVYALKYAKSRDGVVGLTVWTHKQAGYGGGFDDFFKTLTTFLNRQGVSIAQGCVLDVYGPDGTRLHHYETTRENSS